tara:strand:+ start:252 stop:1355 length:1104 start_codon:yes stop_codon:yes gene_type:complete
MFKKRIFYFLTFSFIVLFYFSLDFILSNTLLKNDSCYDYKTYKKGYFYFLKKNCQTRDRFKKNFPTTSLFTDDFGLRIGKNTIKNTNYRNILIFGDSMTFGVGLEYENTYAGLIDKKMDNYNVYNFGVGSYAPSVHLYKLENAIKNNIIPSKILLFLDLSDVRDEARRWVDDEDGIPKRPEGKPHWARSKDIGNVFIERNFNLSKDLIAIIRLNLRNLRNRTKNIIIKDNQNLIVKKSIQGQFTYTDIKNLDKRFWKKNDFRNGLKKIKKKINEISIIAKQNKSEFYLIIYPWGETLYMGEEQFSWSNFGEDLCSNQNCTLINAIPNFKAYKENNKNWLNELYFLNDEHLNKGGAKLLSNIVIEAIN